MAGALAAAVRVSTQVADSSKARRRLGLVAAAVLADVEEQEAAVEVDVVLARAHSAAALQTST